MSLIVCKFWCIIHAIKLKTTAALKQMPCACLQSTVLNLNFPNCAYKVIIQHQANEKYIFKSINVVTYRPSDTLVNTFEIMWTRWSFISVFILSAIKQMIKWSRMIQMAGNMIVKNWCGAIRQSPVPLHTKFSLVLKPLLLTFAALDVMIPFSSGFLAGTLHPGSVRGTVKDDRISDQPALSYATYE